MPHKLTNILSNVPSDLEIAQAATPLPIDRIAAEAGVKPEELELYGKTKAKVSLGIRDRMKNAPNGKYVVVTAVGTRRLGLVVDSLVGEQDVVIKPLGPSIKNVPGFAGATELADQRIALVLDAPALVEEMFANADRTRLSHGGTHGF